MQDELEEDLHRLIDERRRRQQQRRRRRIRRRRRLERHRSRVVHDATWCEKLKKKFLESWKKL